jgi:hypothetical protein
VGALVEAELEVNKKRNLLITKNLKVAENGQIRTFFSAKPKYKNFHAEHGTFRSLVISNIELRKY